MWNPFRSKKKKKQIKKINHLLQDWQISFPKKKIKKNLIKHLQQNYNYIIISL